MEELGEETGKPEAFPATWKEEIKKVCGVTAPTAPKEDDPPPAKDKGVSACQATLADLRSAAYWAANRFGLEDGCLVREKKNI